MLFKYFQHKLPRTKLTLSNHYMTYQYVRGMCILSYHMWQFSVYSNLPDYFNQEIKVANVLMCFMHAQSKTDTQTQV